jgi:hypothetical protein
MRNLSADCTRLVIRSSEYHNMNGKRSIDELKTEKHPVVSGIFAI